MNVMVGIILDKGENIDQGILQALELHVRKLGYAADKLWLYPGTKLECSPPVEVVFTRWAQKGCILAGKEDC